MGVQALLRSITGLVASFALAACGSAQVADRHGDAPRVVSLNPCIDAMLVEIAAPGQILALSHYSSHPSSSSIDPDIAAHFAMTGGTAEEVIALSPDLVLASSFIDPATRNALERAGLVVETFASPSTLAESAEQITRLGALIERTEAAEELNAGIAAGAGQGETGGPRVLLWQSGEIVAGERTLIAELLAEAGFTSHAARLGLSQADRVSLEEILADPPDLLLVAGDSAGQLHPGLRNLDGTHLAAFDPRLFYCGGPSITAARERLAAIRAEMRE